MVHLYVGDGKGKTTCAVGLAVRALGVGKRVLFSQFLKGRATGEIQPLEQLGADLLRAKAGDKFVFQMSTEERCQAKDLHTKTLLEIQKRMTSGQYDLIVMDEVVDAVNCGVVELSLLLELLAQRPKPVELVLSGRNPPEELVACCDYYTEFLCHKHPYQHGIPARKGIEY